MTPEKFRARMRRLIGLRLCSKGEAAEAEELFDKLAERELRGEITHAQAMAEIDLFGRAQMRRRNIS
jgi:hypothetical protein